MDPEPPPRPRRRLSKDESRARGCAIFLLPPLLWGAWLVYQREAAQDWQGEGFGALFVCAMLVLAGLLFVLFPGLRRPRASDPKLPGWLGAMLLLVIFAAFAALLWAALYE